MSTMNTFFQDDWSGGENSLLSPEKIEENEAVTLLNMLPRRNQSGVSLRKGFKTIYDNLGGKVYGMFIKRKADGTKHLLAAVNDSGTVKLNYYGELGGLNAVTFYPAVSAAIEYYTPPTAGAAYFQVQSNSTLTYYEKGTLDNWTSNQTPADNATQTAWNDGSLWSSPSHGYVVFSVTTPNKDSRVVINTEQFASYELGRVSVKYRKGVLGSWTDPLVQSLGVFDIGADIHFDVDVLDYGEYQIRVDIQDSPGATGDISGGTVTGVTVIEQPTITTLCSFTTSPDDFNGVWFSDWDADRLFFSDGEDGLYTWNFSGTASLVQDKSAAPDDNMDGNFAYLIQHKGRLVMAEKNNVRLWICGSDDSVNARWESWSGASASSGGTVDAVPYGSYIKGLSSSYAGVLIFKEDGVYLWSYSEAAAPWDATNASIEVIASGVGCLSHDTIARDGNTTYFMGRTDAGSVALYKMDGSSLTAMSNKIPKAFDDIARSGDFQMYGNIVDDYYVLVSNDGDGRRVTIMFDLVAGCWISASSPDITSAYRPLGEPYMLFGGTGNIYKYPSDEYFDGYGQPIPWEIKTRRLIAPDDPNAEVYLRNNWFDASANSPVKVMSEMIYDKGNLHTLETQTVANSSSDFWTSSFDATDDDSSVWNDGTVWGKTYKQDKYYLETGDRAYGATWRLYGESLDEVGFNRVSVGFRPRRVRNVRDA